MIEHHHTEAPVGVLPPKHPRLQRIIDFLATGAVIALSLPLLSFDAETRHEIGQRDQWQCVRCGRSFFDGWLVEMNHITPEWVGGPNTVDNGETLCVPCHAQFHLERAEATQAEQEWGAYNLIHAREEATDGGHTREWLEEHGDS